MLILARCRGKSVYVGERKVTVAAVRPPIAVISIDGRDHVRRVGERIDMGDGEIAVMSVNYAEAKLGFEFPGHVNIRREELAEE